MFWVHIEIRVEFNATQRRRRIKKPVEPFFGLRLAFETWALSRRTAHRSIVTNGRVNRAYAARWNNGLSATVLLTVRRSVAAAITKSIIPFALLAASALLGASALFRASALLGAATLLRAATILAAAALLRASVLA